MHSFAHFKPLIALLASEQGRNLLPAGSRAQAILIGKILQILRQILGLSTSSHEESLPGNLAIGNWKNPSR